MSEHLLDVKNLKTVFHMHEGVVRAVDNVSFHLDEGEIIAIVGESGSGKSVSMMSILKLISMPPGEILGGEVWFKGENILAMEKNSKEMRSIRGGGISMIFQEPMTSLNPVLTIGDQIAESIMLHLGYSRADARKRTVELLTQVGIPDAQSRIDYYPTQFSGGMRQRIMIAMAMACNPKILIADEATTALDVTTQEQILELLRDIVKQTNTALIIITHNLSIVARYAERVYVMYSGNVVEQGTSEEVFHQAAHPYTMGLLNAIPRLDSDKSKQLVAIKGFPPNPAKKPAHCAFYARCPYACETCTKPQIPDAISYSDTHTASCWFHREQLMKMNAEELESLAEKTVSSDVIMEVKELCKEFPVYSKGFFRRKTGSVWALDNVSFQVYRGETLGIVGESGCGKTTLAKTILRLYDASHGSIIFNGRDICKLKERDLGDVRRQVQFIFQDPYGSLDPRQSAGSIVGESLKAHKLCKTPKDYNRRIDELFQAVGLDPALKDRVPHEFSGGQRQRLSIASALASDPSFVICDEPISALDVSIQAQIINLLIDLQAKRGLTYLFIAHDLSVVRHISDRIVVMYLGKVVEVSRWDELYSKPLHPYTKALLSAIPIPDPTVEKQRVRTRIEGEVPSIVKRPTGCVFHNRCPHATERCKAEIPPLRSYGNEHLAACFYAEEQHL